MKNEPAFPNEAACKLAAELNDTKTLASYIGLTKREYFAGLAMQGYTTRHNGFIEDDTEAMSIAAKNSVNAADALLAELAKEVENEG